MTQDNLDQLTVAVTLIALQGERTEYIRRAESHARSQHWSTSDICRDYHETVLNPAIDGLREYLMKGFTR